MLGPRFLLCVIFSVAALFAVACGGGDDDDSSSSQFDVDCGPLESLSYRFKAESVAEVKASQAPPVTGNTPVVPPPTRIVVEVEAAVQGADRTAGVQRLGDGIAFQDTNIVAIGDTMWLLAGQQWLEQVKGPLPAIAYAPLDGCVAIAPDAALAGLSPTSEDVNGIPSLHYRLDASGEFFARNLSIGPTSDMASLISSIAVDIWIAEDGDYPTKLHVSGEGEYPDGRTLVAEVSYEIVDISPSIEITPPPVATKLG